MLYGFQLMLEIPVPFGTFQQITCTLSPGVAASTETVRDSVAAVNETLLPVTPVPVPASAYAVQEKEAPVGQLPQ